MAFVSHMYMNQWYVASSTFVYPNWLLISSEHSFTMRNSSFLLNNLEMSISLTTMPTSLLTHVANALLDTCLFRNSPSHNSHKSLSSMENSKLDALDHIEYVFIQHCKRIQRNAMIPTYPLYLHLHIRVRQQSKLLNTLATCYFLHDCNIKAKIFPTFNFHARFEGNLTHLYVT